MTGRREGIKSTDQTSAERNTTQAERQKKFSKSLHGLGTSKTSSEINRQKDLLRQQIQKHSQDIIEKQKAQDIIEGQDKDKITDYTRIRGLVSRTERNTKKYHLGRIDKSIALAYVLRKEDASTRANYFTQRIARFQRKGRERKNNIDELEAFESALEELPDKERNFYREEYQRNLAELFPTEPSSSLQRPRKRKKIEDPQEPDTTEKASTSAQPRRGEAKKLKTSASSRQEPQRREKTEDPQETSTSGEGQKLTASERPMRKTASKAEKATKKMYDDPWNRKS